MNLKLLMQKIHGVVNGVVDLEDLEYKFGLGESSLDHRRREEFPVIFCLGERKNHCILVGNAVYYI